MRLSVIKIIHNCRQCVNNQDFLVTGPSEPCFNQCSNSTSLCGFIEVLPSHLQVLYHYTNASIQNYNSRVALSAMETEVTVLKPSVMELVCLMQTIFCMLLGLFLHVVMVPLLLLLLVN